MRSTKRNVNSPKQALKGDNPGVMRVVFLDFDGVVLESAEVKLNAFRVMFSGHDRRGEIYRYLDEHAGVSRYEKFCHIHGSILQQPLSRAEIDRLAKVFSGLAREGVLAAPFVAGAQEFLELYQDRYPLYVVSATPQAELSDIVGRRGLNGYFKGVFGSPTSKSARMASVLATLGHSPDTAVFVGDSIEDLAEARKAKVRFVGRVHPGTASPFGDLSERWCVADLGELARRWPSLFEVVG